MGHAYQGMRLGEAVNSASQCYNGNGDLGMLQWWI